MAHALFSDVCWIIRHLKTHGHDAYLVGGAVRDLFLGRPPEDFDIATTASPDTIFSIFPRVKPVGKAFGTTLVILEHRPYQLTTLQSSGGSYTAVMETDILRRDFTINALFYDPTEDRLIDIVGGMRDLHARLLRPVTTAKEIFEDDPIRMLRAIRIAHTLGFSIDPSLPPTIRKMRHKITTISPERIQYELVKILSLPNVLDALCPLVKSRILFEIFPELLPLRDLAQSPYHDFRALSHTFRVLAHTEQLLVSPPLPSLRPEVPKYVMMLAALFHDIGKSDTHLEENGYHHFYGHEKAGAVKTEEILKRLRFSKKDLIAVKNLVRRHLYPLHLYRHYLDHTLTERAITRFLRKEKKLISSLLLLSTADQRAKRRKNHKTEVSWTAFLKRLFSPPFNQSQDGR